MPITPLTPEPDLVERVHHALLDAIGDGTLAPGQRLTQDQLAERFGVSRQPVLQALRVLKAEGLVLDAPGRGVQVAPLTARSVEQVYEVRCALDAMAARLAARRASNRASAAGDGSADRATAAPTRMATPLIDLGLIEAGRRAVRQGRLKDLIDADHAFHQAIYRAADNPLIERSAALHWAHVRRAMGVRLASSSLRDHVWDEHEAIATAINAGRDDQAAALALGHGERASRHIVARLDAAAAA
jgi:DNA-binding GntR family transcriptional regulator